MITKMEFPNERRFETTLAGRPLVVETGKLAGLSNASCMVRWGDTCVLVNATASKKPRDGIDFFPLSVDFEEKLYAVGRIPGSFMRREGRPSERAILASRLIDRPIRPLFPSDMRNDVVISCTVMSVDHDNLPEIAAMIGTSIALSISDIPWGGPIGGVNMGYVNGAYVVCPNSEQRQKSQLNVTVAGTADKVVMIEAGADQFPDDQMLRAIAIAHDEIKKLVAFIDGIKKEIGKEKFDFEHITVPAEMYEDVKNYAEAQVREAILAVDKTVRDKAIDALTDEVIEKFGEKYPDSEKLFGECMYKLQKYVVRRMLLDEQKRVDGRSLTEVRPLAAEVGLLPRVHGSGLFTRGQTQVLTTCTLGTLRDAQELDTIYEETEKRYMHHYNFPGFSVGEAKPSRSPGRREIGHGALAERALRPVIPSEEEFPYSLRLVSEVLSSNGSTSQASVCGSTLSLMAAGVPIKRPVAGISCGLVTGDTDDDFILLTDIQGLEDFFGDMDFKVAGTHDGITAIQMDIKIHGLTRPIVEEAIRRTKEAREYILTEVMEKCIAAPRTSVGEYAPKIIQIQIDPQKIGDVVGQRGKTINTIIERTGVKIDITDEGAVSICGVDQKSMDEAANMVKIIATDFEAGQIFTGKVVSIKEFGAFLEFAPGKEGMVHISKIAKERINRVEDVLTLGDVVKVVCLGKDKMGRISFSIKDCKEN